MVCFNDNEMWISPPVAATPAYLSRLYSGMSTAACARPNTSSAAADSVRRLRQPRRRAVARLHRRARYARVSAFRLSAGPIDGHDLDALIADAARHEEAARAAVSCARRHAQGQRLRLGGGVCRSNITSAAKFDVPTGISRRRRNANAPDLQPSVRRRLASSSEADKTPRSRHHRGNAVRHRALTSLEGLSERTFDCRDRRQHAVTFASRTCHRVLKSSCASGDLDFLLQRGYDQVVHDVAIQSLRSCSRSRPASSAPTARPPARSTTPIGGPAQFRHHGGVRRGGTGAHGRDAGGDQLDAPSAVRYPRGEGRGVETP